MDNMDLKLKEIFTSTTLTKRQKILNAERILTAKLDIEATIFLSWLQYFHRGYVNSGTLILLDNLLENVEMDSLSSSLIYLAKSWSAKIDEEQSNYFLEKSIESHTYVENCLKLATSYRNKGYLDKEQDLLLKALRNIEMIYPMDESFSAATVKSYLSDRFKGIVNIPTYDVPTYNTLKRESILRNVIDSNTVSDIMERLKISN